MLFGGADAVSSASLVVEQPSGEFCVLINRERLKDSAGQWEVFFNGQDAGVIFEDIGCITVQGDTAGIQLARRYQSRLPENQMKVHTQFGMLVLSKAEYHRFDVIVVSRETAEAYGFKDHSDEDTLLIVVKGETDEEG